MTKNLDQIIEAARTDLADKKMIAFLGDQYTGKTVTCGIIRHALGNHFVPDSNGKWDAWVTEGRDRLNKIVTELENGNYPAKTLPSDPLPITIEIFSKDGVGGSIDIVFRDMSGEIWKKLLVDEYPSVDERTMDILTTSTIEGKLYGLLSHILFAKMYVIVIDCEEIDHWSEQQRYLAPMMKSLLDMKKRIGDVVNNKIINPIAIFFSKYDTLKPKDQKPPEELLKKLPEFMSALRIAHSGEIKLFTGSIESTKRTSTELAKLRQEVLKTKNKELLSAKNDVNEKNAARENAKSELSTVKSEFQEAQNKLEDAKTRKQQPEIDQASTEYTKIENRLDDCQKAYNNSLQEFENARNRQKEIEEKISSDTSSLKQLGISEYKVNKPLKYNLDEYLELISWIIEMNKR